MKEKQSWLEVVWKCIVGTIAVVASGIAFVVVLLIGLAFKYLWLILLVLGGWWLLTHLGASITLTATG